MATNLGIIVMESGKPTINGQSIDLSRFARVDSAIIANSSAEGGLESAKAKALDTALAKYKKSQPFYLLLEQMVIDGVPVKIPDLFGEEGGWEKKVLSHEIFQGRGVGGLYFDCNVADPEHHVFVAYYYADK